jgi:hypothetical protein
MDERCLQMKLFPEIRILRIKLHRYKSMRQKKLSLERMSCADSIIIYKYSNKFGSVRREKIELIRLSSVRFEIRF